MANNLVPSANTPVLDSHGQLLPEMAEALADVARGMSKEGAAVKHRVTVARIKRARKVPQGSQLMRRIKREMRLPDRMGKDELLHKIQLWIEREEVKEEAKLPDLVGAAMNYARLAGYLEGPKVAVQNNVVVGAEVDFAAVLQRVADRQRGLACCENAASAAVDI